MPRVLVGAVLSLLMAFIGRPVFAEPVAVRFSEGITRGFPVLRSLTGDILAQGELIQVARGDRVESRLIFRFRDGSLYDEQVVFSQRDVFTLQNYQIIQRGPSFPESLEARVDRATERYEVRYRADDDSALETLSGDFTLPGDVYNGLLSTLMKNLPAGGSATVQIVAFTPKPRLVKMQLTPAAEDPVQMNHAALTATRFVVRPQLGLLASMLFVDVPDLKCWILGGEAPAFVRFEGPLYFMGPIWRIDWN